MIKRELLSPLSFPLSPPPSVRPHPPALSLSVPPPPSHHKTRNSFFTWWSLGLQGGWGRARDTVCLLSLLQTREGSHFRKSRLGPSPHSEDGGVGAFIFLLHFPFLFLGLRLNRGQGGPRPLLPDVFELRRGFDVLTASPHHHTSSQSCALHRQPSPKWVLWGPPRPPEISFQIKRSPGPSYSASLKLDGSPLLPPCPPGPLPVVSPAHTRSPSDPPSTPPLPSSSVLRPLSPQHCLQGPAALVVSALQPDSQLGWCPPAAPRDRKPRGPHKGGR